MTKKYFTIEEANELIPTLEREIIDLQQLQKTFKNKLKQLNGLKNSNKHYLQTETADIFTLESELEFMELQAELHVRNIESSGAQFKGVDLGLIDFPSMMNEEEVLLCWKQGEAEITHFHGVDEGFAGRKPIY